ncbi:helix-turn-helix domain-containing protein, partial [Mycobacteroides abscessus]|uniref:helix-turn-helix domain-containing protein n=2 Tax=Mycobacteriaceae TaxID=1762 RepID=UPI000C25D98C
MTAMTELPRAGSVPTDSLSNRLVLVRQERKLSQRAAAELSGLTFAEWQGMELGRAARRIDVKVRQIAEALGVDRDWLMWGGQLTPEGVSNTVLTHEYESSRSGLRQSAKRHGLRSE